MAEDSDRYKLSGNGLGRDRRNRIENAAKENGIMLRNIESASYTLDNALHTHGRLESTQTFSSTRQACTQAQKYDCLSRREVVQCVQQDLKMPGKVLFVLGEHIEHFFDTLGVVDELCIGSGAGRVGTRIRHRVKCGVDLDDKVGVTSYEVS
jgi:hypothetical protein